MITLGTRQWVHCVCKMNLYDNTRTVSRSESDDHIHFKTCLDRLNILSCVITLITINSTSFSIVFSVCSSTGDHSVQHLATYVLSGRLPVRYPKVCTSIHTTTMTTSLIGEVQTSSSNLLWSVPPLSDSSAPPPPGLTGHTCHRINDRQILVIGGKQLGMATRGDQIDTYLLTIDKGDNDNAELGRSSIISWSFQRTIGQRLGRRWAHATVEIPGDRILLFGGFDHQMNYGDCNILHTDSWNWTSVSSFLDQQPHFRAYHSLTLIPDYSPPPSSSLTSLSPASSTLSSSAADFAVLLLGGCYCENGEYHHFNDVHVFHLSTMTWERKVLLGAIPISRCQHSVSLIGTRAVVMCGGSDSYQVMNDVWLLDIRTFRWKLLNTVGENLPQDKTLQPTPFRLEHTLRPLVVCGSSLVSMGNLKKGNGEAIQIYQLNLRFCRWRRLTRTNDISVDASLGSMGDTVRRAGKWNDCAVTLTADSVWLIGGRELRENILRVRIISGWRSLLNVGPDTLEDVLTELGIVDEVDIDQTNASRSSHDIQDQLSLLQPSSSPVESTPRLFHERPNADIPELKDGVHLKIFIDRSIACGSRGWVYRAAYTATAGDFQNHVEVAFKKIEIVHDLPPRVVDLYNQALRKQAKIAWMLNGHPNIPHLYGWCREPRGLVMEFCNSGSLKQWLWCAVLQVDSTVLVRNESLPRSHPRETDSSPSTAENEAEGFVTYESLLAAKTIRGILTPSQRKLACRSLLDAVSRLHLEHLSHGDIKSENILVNKEASGVLQFKLCDYGSANFQASFPNLAMFSTLRASPMEGGTTRYLAQEKFEMDDLEETDGRKVKGEAGGYTKDNDRAADIYSAGLVIAEILTALPPYHRCITEHSVNRAMLQKKPPYEEAMLSDVNPLLTTFVDQCRLPPADRPKISNVLELWENLRGFLPDT